MAVYLLLCVPVVYLLNVALTSSEQVWFGPGEYRYSLTPAVKGAVWFTPAVVAVLLSESMLPVMYEPGRLFLHHLLHEIGIPFAIGLLGALLFTRTMRRESDILIHVAMTAVFAGYFTVAGVVDLFREVRFLDPYTLIILPTLRAVMMVLAPMLITAWRREARTTRYIYLGGLVLLVPTLSVPGFLFSLNWHLFAYLTTAAVTLLSGVGYVLLFRGAFPMLLQLRPKGTVPSTAAAPPEEGGTEEAPERSAGPGDVVPNDGES